MSNKKQFEKPLKLTKICLLLSGINLYKTQWNPILEIVINNFIYYFNIVILYSVIFAEIYWLLDGIQIGRDFVEMSLNAPCITISILSTFKTVPLFFKRDLLCQTIDVLKEIHPELADYKKNTGSSKKKQNTKEVLNLEVEEKTKEVVNESVKLLILVGFLLSSISIAVLVTFLLAPLVLIYRESFTTGQMKIKYPFYVKYWFDAYEVKFWPLVYFQQSWASK